MGLIKLGNDLRRQNGLISSSPALSPLSSSPECIAEFAADRLALSHLDPVDTWNDETGNGNHVSNTGASRPTYHATGGPNGGPMVEFFRGAVATWLTRATWNTPGDNTVRLGGIVICNRGSNGSFQELAVFDSLVTEFRINTTDHIEFISDGSDAHSYILGWSLGTWIIASFAIVADGASNTSAFRINASVSGTFIFDGPVSYGDLSIGARNDGSVFFDGSIAHIRLYQDVAPAVLIGTEATELNNFYGVY